MSERDFKREGECLHHNYVPRDCPVCLRIALKEARLAEAAAVKRAQKADADLAAERAAEERAAKLYTESEAKNRALRAELTQRTLDYAGWMQGIPQERDAAVARYVHHKIALETIAKGDYHTGGSTCLSMMACCDGAEELASKALKGNI